MTPVGGRRAYRLRRSCCGRGGSRCWPLVVPVLWWRRVGGWGCARLRQVRTHSGVRWLRPRRGRCRDRGCGTTHVLLPDVCLARRVYVADVIGEALLSLGREGYRRAGERLGVPGETVREWRRRFRSRAEVIAVHFLWWARALDASLDPPADRGSLAADALGASPPERGRAVRTVYGAVAAAQRKQASSRAHATVITLPGFLRSRIRRWIR